MKRNSGEGLVCAGAVTRSFLARMPTFLSRLGPVKASSYRVARRIANAMRGGSAVHDYSQLAACDVLWLAVPDDSLDATVGELSNPAPRGASILDRTMVVLCESAHDSRSLAPLRTVGASIASINAVPETREHIFVAEGDRAVISELRRLFAKDGRKVIALEPGTKPFFLAGIHFSSHLLLPWIGGAVQSLRIAGFSRADATRLAESLGSRALRSYVKAGSKAWSPAAAGELRDVLSRDLAAMRHSAPRLAALYSSGVENATKAFREM